MSALSPAREIAFRILRKVETGGYASDLLRQLSVPLDARDAALAETLVFGCLRYQSQLDFLIGHYSGKSSSRLDSEVRIALRLGIFQLRYLERIPAHAAVMESVELVKRARKLSAAGLVNAVLRKVNRDPVVWPDRATELSIPEWILARWDREFGAEAAIKIAKAALEEPETNVNPETGRMQDIGAQSIVPLLKVEPGMTALDLCAAPGNKTAQLMAAQANVIACDLYLKRLAEVPPETARVALDASRNLPFHTKFDRILVDAPCSGSGTLGRNPEIKWRLQASDLREFQMRQRQILENALAHLKPDGLLVYSTCSLEPEENQKVVEGLNVQEMRVRLPGREAGDGFFAAVITL